METLSIILNFVLASGLAGTLLFFRSKRRKEKAEADSAEIDNTEKVVAMQSEHITRLDGRVEKLEEKVDKLEIIIEHKDVEIDRNRIVIRQAYKCATPPEQCPVLIKRAEIEKHRKEVRNESRTSES
nr:MAG TPA: shock protein B [Caudoviricetes sp.]